ncbi:MAG: hypothetical protein ACPG5T_07075 [Endozoicomonas sp.]
MKILQSLYLSSMALLTSAAVSSETPLNPGGCSFVQMQAFYMKALGISDRVQIKHIQRRMPEPNMRGYTKPLGGSRYLVALADSLEPSEIRVTLAHELVHVRQLEQGQIKKAEFKKHYMERSFEDEAFRLSIPLAIQFYTKHQCQKTPNRRKQKDKSLHKR